MIIPDSKKVVSVILSKQGGGKMKDMEHASEESMEVSPLKVISEDFLMAISNKSSHDLSVALQALVSHIQALDEEQDAQGE